MLGIQPTKAIERVLCPGHSSRDRQGLCIHGAGLPVGRGAGHGLLGRVSPTGSSPGVGLLDGKLMVLGVCADSSRRLPVPNLQKEGAGFQEDAGKELSLGTVTLSHLAPPAEVCDLQV